jgi:hypothetical protein
LGEPTGTADAEPPELPATEICTTGIPAIADPVRAVTASIELRQNFISDLFLIGMLMLNQTIRR